MRSGSLSMTSLVALVIGGLKRVSTVAGNLKRAISTTATTGLNWSAGTTSTAFSDNSPGDNTTYVVGTTGGAVSVSVAMWDLGSAKTVTRFRRTRGTKNGNAWPTVIEGSNDGTTWNDAWTGIPPAGEVGGPSFAWSSEEDFSTVTATPYRYWRTVIQDSGASAEARIGDFRLYVAGVLQT